MQVHSQLQLDNNLEAMIKRNHGCKSDLNAVVLPAALCGSKFHQLLRSKPPTRLPRACRLSAGTLCGVAASQRHLPQGGHLKPVK